MKILATALAVLFACPAYAGECYDRTVFAEAAAKDGYSRAFIGLMDSAWALIEVYVNEETREWVVMKSFPSGKTCYLDRTQGDAFEYINAPAGEVN